MTNSPEIQTLDTQFLDELASSSPTPGGGGASAYGAALASALTSMVASLTVGKKKYAEVEQEMQQLLQDLEHERATLLELVDADAQAFKPLARAYGMPRATEEEKAAKTKALQEALIEACEVPLEIMRHCAQIIELTEFAADHGSRLAVSDAGVAAVFAHAALRGASLNVRINIKSMHDTKRALRYENEMNNLLNEYGVRAENIYAGVVKELQ